jgi:hypothetical protein
LECILKFIDVPICPDSRLWTWDSFLSPIRWKSLTEILSHMLLFSDYFLDIKNLCFLKRQIIMYSDFISSVNGALSGSYTNAF